MTADTLPAEPELDKLVNDLRSLDGISYEGRMSRQAANAIDALRFSLSDAIGRAEKLQAVIEKIDHEVRDNFLSVYYDSTSAYDDWKEAHRICDDIANIIDASVGAQ